MDHRDDKYYATLLVVLLLRGDRIKLLSISRSTSVVE